MKHIFIVDAHAENLLFLRTLFEKKGWVVTEARHGVEALTSARINPPDLVVSDLAMPVMDGYTFLRRWRNDAKLCEIPFVVHTALHAEPADEMLALALGADAFIARPAEPDEIVTRLEAVLARAASGNRAPADPRASTVEAQLQEANADLIRKLEKKARDLETAYGELGARETRLRTILENEPECVKLLAADGTLLEMNPAGLAMIEAEHFSEVANQCIYPLVAPAHREQFRRLTDATFGGESGVLEFEMVGLKGGRRWLETHAAPLRDRTGKVTALIGITRDITRSKIAQLELRRGEERFRRIMEAGMMGMIFWNTAGEISEANDEFLRIVGYDRRDLQEGRLNWKKMTPPEYQSMDEAAVAAVVATGTCTPFEKEYLRKDGSRVPILIGGASLPEQPGHGVAFVLDISKRRAAQEALRESESRYRGFFEYAPLGIAEGDVATTKFISVNQHYANILGYSRDELLKLTFKDFTHPDDLATDLDLFSELTAGKRESYEIEKRYIRKDGKTIWAILSVTAIPTPTGEVTRCLAIFNDVTTRRRAEHERTEAFERITDAFVALDRDWRYTYVNDKAGKLLGRAPADLIGKHIWTEFPEGKGRKFHLAYERAIATQESIVLEEYYAPYDRWFENRIFPSPEGLSIYFHDITQRKVAEETIKQYETIFDQAGWGMVIVDPGSGRFTKVNPAFARMHGFTVEEMKNMSLMDVFAPREKGLLADRAQEAAEKGHYVYEAVHQRKDGSTFPCLTDVTAFKDPAGKVLFRAATFEDISERRNTEEKVHTQLAELQRWHSLTVDREDRVLELKREVNALLARQGMPARYNSVEPDSAATAAAATPEKP